MVLAWNSKILFKSAFPLPTLGSVWAVDLDLEVTDVVTGQLVGASRSYDNSYEVVEFTGVHDRTYRIDVVLSGVYKEAEVAWFGIAWRGRQTGEE